jgi:hypothetical protein
MSADYKGKVIIFTAFYRQEAYAPYIHSLLVTITALERMGWRWDFAPTLGDFHLERAINDSLSRFAENEEASDWINIDSDHEWSPEDLCRMLLSDDPVLCASYPMTNKFDTYTGVLEIDDSGQYKGIQESENRALLSALRVPAGFLRLKKAVVRKWIENHPDDWFWMGEGEERRKVYAFFWNRIVDHQFVGMDMALSDDLRNMGVPLYIDPNLRVDHWGPTRHKGSLDKHLRNKVKMAEAAKAFNTVKTMAAEIQTRDGEAA